MTKQTSDSSKKKNPALQLIAGGTAGFVESSICHPLDTIKTRMQLRRQQSTLNAVRARSSLMEPGMRPFSSFAEPKLNVLKASVESKIPHARAQAITATLGPFGTAKRIVKREGFFSLYKGLTAVYCGIIPKMVSFKCAWALFIIAHILTLELYRLSGSSLLSSIERLCKAWLARQKMVLSIACRSTLQLGLQVG